MVQRPKRIPGEANPDVDPTAAHLIQNAESSAPGEGAGDYGVRAAIQAWGRWVQRRRQRKAIAAYKASKRQ